MFCRMLSCALFGALVCGAVSTAVARTWEDGIAAEVSDGTNTVPYRYYLPDNYDPADSYPLVLSLHGSGERGSNNITQVAVVHTSGLIEQTYQNYPSILVVPQAPINSNWSTSSTRELTGTILQRMHADFAVDANRLYVTGFSMGGFGTLDYLDDYTNTDSVLPQFAAAVPVAGGTGGLVDLSQIEPWKGTPIWLLHGDSDGTVSVDLSRHAFRSYIGLGQNDPIDFNASAFCNPSAPTLCEPTAIADNIRLTEVVGGDHGITFLYNRTELYDWMFAQSLAIPEPSSVLLALMGFFSIGSRPSRSRRG